MGATTFGRRWFTAHAVVSVDGGLSCSFEYDLPQEPAELRTVSDSASDLLIYPRPPDRVPGWLKVELALVGAWDLVKDRLTVNKGGSQRGRPQTAASVGVPLPAGAEHAWTPGVFEGLVDSAPGQSPAAEDGVEEWAMPSVLPAEGMVGLRDRWNRLAVEFWPLVRVWVPGTSSTSGEGSVGVARLWWKWWRRYLGLL